MDVALEINPETGFPIVGNKMAVSFHIDDITITKNNFENWKVTFENMKGETKTGKLNNVMQDETLNMVTATMRIKK